MAVADASFNISIEAISFGLISFIEPEVTPNADINGIPSTTYNGSLDEVIERLPRILTMGNSPGFTFVATLTPAALPWIACNAFITGLSSIVFADMLVTAPVTSLL